MSERLGRAIRHWKQVGEAGGMFLILVRHGATDWNLSRRLQGQKDIPLSEAGRQQAREAAQVLGRIGLVALYTSPLSRARESGAEISRVTGAPLQVRGDLSERSLGAMEGLTPEEVEQLFPQRRRNEESVPGLEPYVQLQRRAAGALAALAQEHPRGLVAVVSHGAFINAFLSLVSGGFVGSGVTNLANGGLSVVTGAPTLWRIAEVNLSGHLSNVGGQTL